MADRAEEPSAASDVWLPGTDGRLVDRDLGTLEQMNVASGRCSAIGHDRIERAKVVALDTMVEHADAIVHIDTGIGLPEATAHARFLASRYAKPFLVYHPPRTYEELVFGPWDGLPGPGAHQFTFTMLKGRCVRQLLRDHRSKIGQRFLLLTGVRHSESARRMGMAEPVRRVDGGQVWVNPLFEWADDEMHRYRATHDLPRSEVSDNLHLSGECLCGAFAKPGEREAIRFFYPTMDRRLSSLEEECRTQGKTYCEWGTRRGDGKEPAGFRPMCVGCSGQQALDLTQIKEATSGT